jgi:hypothetical protein
MKTIVSSGALALSALLAQPAQAQAQAQVESPQQTQKAQQDRQQAEAYLRKEEAAITGRQNQSTDRANQDAGVADEAAGHSDAARPARSTSPNMGARGASGTSGNTGASPAGSTPPPSYGPVLNPRQPQSKDPARKDPAEVHDETDTLIREAPPKQSQQSQQSPQTQQQKQKQARQAQRRREAWQPAGPLAPRSLSGSESAAIGSGALRIPAPAQAPQPVVPSIAPLNSCVGGACRDTAGGTYNIGPGGTGVSSGGRLCSTTGSTVSCF